MVVQKLVTVCVRARDMWALSEQGLPLPLI